MDDFTFYAIMSYAVYAVLLGGLIAYGIARGAAAKRALEAAERRDRPQG